MTAHANDGVGEGAAPPPPRRTAGGVIAMAGDELFRSLAKAILLAAGVVVALWLLVRITWVLLFFLLAMVLALAINVPVTWMERRGMHRAAAVALTFATLGAFLAGTGWLIVPVLIRELTTLLQLLPAAAADLVNRVAESLSAYPELERELRLDATTASQIVPWAIGTIRNLWNYGLTLVVVLVLGLLLFAVIVYMVLDPRPVLAMYLASLPPHLREPGVRAFTRASQTVVGWVYASVVISALKAVPAYFFLTWIGLPGALVWSVFTFVADLVPRLGFYLMIVPPVLVALAIDAQMALWIAVFYWAISEILGNFVAPRIQASAMNLNPVFLLFVTLGMVTAFGVLGAIIASPVAGFLRAYYEEFYLARLPAPRDSAERVEDMLTRRLPERGG